MQMTRRDVPDPNQQREKQKIGIRPSKGKRTIPMLQPQAKSCTNRVKRGISVMSKKKNQMSQSIQA